MNKKMILLQQWYRAWRYRLKLDKDEISFLIHTLAQKDTAIDIGAHKGAYTYWMRRCVGKQGKVIAFEPQKELADYLTQIYATDPVVTVENKGLSSQNAQKPLFLPNSDGSPSASFNKMIASEQVETRIVTTVTLDDYAELHQLKNIRLIKCDVEGHELSVFQGANKILHTQKPIFLFECENRHQMGGTIQTVFDYLHDLGYEGYFFIDHELKPISLFDAEKYQSARQGKYINNFIFKPIAAG
jgi:FkbM family methyltransferase